MNILSLDPGKRTGWCFGGATATELRIEPGEDELSLSALHDKISHFIGDGGEHIIYEDFTFRQGARTGLDFTPAKMIGVIELHAEWECDEMFVGFHKQQATFGKGFYTDAKLKELGVYWPHGKGHGRDATRHLLQWANFGAGAEHITMRDVQLELVDTLAK